MNLKPFHALIAIALLAGIASCSDSKMDQKGFPVTSDTNEDDEDSEDGLAKDSLKFDTKPSEVMLTGHPHIRLLSIYKVNKSKRGIPFIGSNNSYSGYYADDNGDGNHWHGHYMPGLETAYGYNLVNVSHYDIQKDLQTRFFERPVLIRTLYYPSEIQDTLYKQPVQRNYFMVSVYDEDSNKDGFVNPGDLRRFYLFDLEGKKQKAILPLEYSVQKSEYDAINDLMYVFAQVDMNKNGQIDEGEETHVFWVDLKDPKKMGRMY